MTKTALDNTLREKNLNALIAYLSANEDVQRVGGNVIAFPTTDAEGNDAWIEMTVKVPKGERLGDGLGFAGYDGYGLAENYALEQKTKSETSAKKAADAAAKKAKADAKKNKVTPTTEGAPEDTAGEDA